MASISFIQNKKSSSTAKPQAPVALKPDEVMKKDGSIYDVYDFFNFLRPELKNQSYFVPQQIVDAQIEPGKNGKLNGKFFCNRSR